MAIYIPFISIIGVAALIVLCVEFDAVRRLVAKILFGSLAIALLIYGACALQNAALAEEDDNEFYCIVAIVSSIEESDWPEMDIIVEVDDLDNLWAYYEDLDIVDFDVDKDIEDIALRFIVDNSILSETLREDPLVEGRIVVIDMWTCGTEDIEDDEILGVYYTEFIAL